METVVKLPSRRDIIALGAAFGLQRAVADAQSPSARTAVRVASAPDEDILATLWAIQSGIFQKHGLDVDLRLSNSGSAVAAGVIGHAIDIGKSSLFSLIAAHLRSIPFELVAAAAVYDSNIPTVGLLVKTGSATRRRCTSSSYRTLPLRKRSTPDASMPLRPQTPSSAKHLPPEKCN